jgi:hypothetical protein
VLSRSERSLQAESCVEDSTQKESEMLTKKTQSIGMLIGLCFVPSLAAAAPPSPVSRPQVHRLHCLRARCLRRSLRPPLLPSIRAQQREASRERPSKLLSLDVEAASAYVWRGINVFGEDQNTQAFSVFPSLTATFGRSAWLLGRIPALW